MLLTCLISIFLLCACDKNQPQSAGQQHKTLPQHRVAVTTISIMPVTIKLLLSGNLEPVTKIRFYSEVNARITRLPFYQGDQIHRGDILVKLDDRLIRSEVEKSRATYKQALADLIRVKKLLSKNISTKEDFNQANTKLQQAKADRDYQLTRLQQTTIKAPIDGVITERLQEPGDYVSVQTHILTLIDPTKFRLKLQLAERYLPLVKIHQSVSVRINGLKNTTIKAKITRIFPTINPDNHKGTIEIQLIPVSSHIRSGQFVKVQLKLQLVSQLLVPNRCIQQDVAGSYVYRVVKTQNGKHRVEKVFFEKGPEYANKTTALSQLHTGDKIVTRGFLGLRNHQSVQIVNTAARPIATSGSTASQ